MVDKKNNKGLANIKLIIDGAINIENMIVLYKDTGYCVFFKSYSQQNKANSEIISNFLTEVFSFGRNQKSQDIFNEFQFGDKKLLLCDGKYLRVGLILNKESSIFLRMSLKKFINVAEQDFFQANWQGQITLFKELPNYIDNYLNTSIYLAHKISFDISNVSSLIDAHSHKIFDITNNLIKDSGSNFFFIPTLLKVALEKLDNYPISEIFTSIKELKNKEILIPIDLEPSDKRQTQQALNLIKRSIANIRNLETEEKQQILNFLTQIPLKDRMVYLFTFNQQNEIVSPPINMKIRDLEIDNIKTAKKEITNLRKNAKSLRKVKDFLNSIDYSMNALTIAISWNLNDELDEIEDFIRNTTIDDFMAKMNFLEDQADQASKDNRKTQAAQNFQLAYQIAIEIYKLGEISITDNIKVLANKVINLIDK